MKRLLSELQRRRVTRVAASYIVASWIMLQVAATLENALTLPAWFDTAVLGLLTLGFPAALVVSWVYELTPEGIRRTVGTGDGKPVKPQAIDWLLIGMLVVVGVVATAMTVATRVGKDAPDDRSIVILPFEDRTQGSDDSGYGDWVAELIGSLLGKASELKVISQTSASAFKGKGVALPEIARQLGVALVVEGRVRREGDDIVISAQLINAATDTQVWAEVYQRKAANALAVQSEVAASIAAAVAAALEATISAGEQRALVASANPQAYEAYRDALRRYRTSAESEVRSAQQSLNHAVELDPDFAAAWALLARAHSFLYFNRSDATEARRAAAEQALAQARRLRPDLLDVMLADAYFEYWVKRDFAGARLRFEALSRKWPSNADVLTALASISRRLGQWEESNRYFERVIAIDPLHAGRRLAAVEQMLATRAFDDALRQIDAALIHWPNAPESTPFLAQKALVHQAQGRLEEAGAVLAGLDPEPDGDLVLPFALQALLQRRPEDAIALLEGLLERDAAAGSIGRASIDLNLYLGDLRRQAGEEEGAMASFRAALDELRLELAKQPDNADIHAYLALAYGGLGERAQAEQHAADAVNAVPVTRDALSGAYYRDVQARVWARFGDGDAAIPALQALMRLPVPMPPTAALLRLDPAFDGLRADPRFAALLESAP